MHSSGRETDTEAGCKTSDSLSRRVVGVKVVKAVGSPSEQVSSELIIYIAHNMIYIMRLRDDLGKVLCHSQL
jgi:hypothetical protein